MTKMPMQNSIQHTTTAGEYSGTPSAAMLRLFRLRLAMRDQGPTGSGKSQERFSTVKRLLFLLSYMALR